MSEGWERATTYVRKSVHGGRSDDFPCSTRPKNWGGNKRGIHSVCYLTIVLDYELKWNFVSGSESL